MLNFNINLTSLAVILWSGMLIISGSIWVLSSQVRKLADILEDRSQTAEPVSASISETRLVATVATARVSRRGAPLRVRGAVRPAVAGARAQAQLIAPRRSDADPRRLAVVERREAPAES
jgi:hypothetical protein